MTTRNSVSFRRLHVHSLVLRWRNTADVRPHRSRVVSAGIAAYYLWRGAVNREVVRYQKDKP